MQRNQILIIWHRHNTPFAACFSTARHQVSSQPCVNKSLTDCRLYTPSGSPMQGWKAGLSLSKTHCRYTPDQKYLCIMLQLFIPLSEQGGHSSQSPSLLMCALKSPSRRMKSPAEAPYRTPFRVSKKADYSELLIHTITTVSLSILISLWWQCNWWSNELHVLILLYFMYFYF